MSLDKFISTVRAEVAKRFDLKTDAEIDAFFIGLEESAKDNQEALEKRDKMLRDTIAELCEAKRLLKAAVEDLRYLESHTVDEEGSCLISDRGERIRCFDCPFNNGGKVNEKCVWNYEAEALKLLGEQNDENN